MYFADALSRARTVNIRPYKLFDESLSVTTIEIVPHLPMQIADETSQDHVLSKFKEAVVSGWSDEKDKVHQDLRPHFTFRHDITYSENVSLNNN